MNTATPTIQSQGQVEDKPGGCGQDEGCGEEDSEELIQGLTKTQVSVLAHKIYALMVDEVRIERERRGQGGPW